MCYNYIQGDTMSKLNVDQKTILDLLSAKKAEFLIPDYQRPYAWNEEQCQTLWDDIDSFAFPDNNHEKFDKNEEYFLGSIVTYKNDQNKSEVIDGQQRLTTLMLILRAFYDKFEHTKDENSKNIRGLIEQCIWKTDEFGNVVKAELKIDSTVATDNDKEEFLSLLRTGKYDSTNKSQYVNNYKFFQKEIDKLLLNHPSNFPYLPVRILRNCILLPIEAESQSTAFRIFSTLNDRGLPLSDADIFKAQFYKHYEGLNQKDDFIRDWKNLEEITNSIFDAKHNTPMDELFTRYMYYLRAQEGNKSSTTEALRKFYERDTYKYLKETDTIENLKSLALFWQSIFQQQKDSFSPDILKKLFILHYAPNGMWHNITSVYFLHNKNAEGLLEEKEFGIFLDKITVFIFAYAITNPGVNALRTPIYDEMVNIIENIEVTFSRYKFRSEPTHTSINNFVFTNQRNITRSIITWYAYTFDDQTLLKLNEKLHLEHIYSGKRQDMEAGLKDNTKLESLGNKILLESSINIRASDYTFDAKKKIYTGEISRGKNKKSSKIFETTDSKNGLQSLNEFGEQQIQERENKIIQKFLDFLKNENLLANEDKAPL